MAYIIRLKSTHVRCLVFEDGGDWHWLDVGHIPDAECAIIRARHNVCAVRREGNKVHWTSGVPIQRLANYLRSGYIPDAKHVVIPAPPTQCVCCQVKRQCREHHHYVAVSAFQLSVGCLHSRCGPCRPWIPMQCVHHQVRM